MLVASISPKIKQRLPPPTFPKFTYQNISQDTMEKTEICLSKINLIWDITALPTQNYLSSSNA